MIKDLREILAQVRNGTITKTQALDVYRRQFSPASPDRKDAVTIIEPNTKDMLIESPLAVRIERPGGVEDLAVVPIERRRPGPDQIVVRVEAASLSFGDLLCLKGLYPDMPSCPFTPGLEASGTVAEVGTGSGNWRPGDEVIVVPTAALGAQAAFVVANRREVFAKPRTLSHVEACSIPAVALTALHAVEKGRLAEEDTILVQTAAGGVGIMTVRLALARNATVIATAGSRAKLDFLRDLGVQHVVDYTREDFEAAVLRFTEGRGVDMVLNTLSGENIQKGINCLSAGGRYVEIAVTGLRASGGLDLSRLQENQEIYSVNLRKLMARSPDRIAGLWEECLTHLNRGTLRPTVCAEFPVERVRDAYSLLESRNNIGKVVLKFPQHREKKASRPSMDHPGVIGGGGPQDTPLIDKACSGSDDGARRCDIAVIGMAGRFGRADDVRGFWQTLKSAESLIESVPQDRWSTDEIYARGGEAPGKSLSKWGSFVRGIDHFDPLFFKISGAEARQMDPQQRLFLQTCWHALEDAAIVPEQLRGSRTDVFCGVANGDYLDLLGVAAQSQAFWGNAASVTPARISYLLDLKGSAIAVDTACSSSLVAVHLACENLRRRDADLALAGGVFIRTSPQFYLHASRARMLSPEGQCYAFDKRANGFVPGEAVAACVLKRLEDAVADGDPIYAIIAATATNQDGATNGITAPNAASQRELELETYRRAGIDPGSIGYVEAHGTGTPLGDPIEIEALTHAFRQFTAKRQYCGIGSAKSNIGHSATAAGVVGLVKAILAVRHGVLPPSIQFRKPNPRIDFDASPFYVVDSLRPWPADLKGVRRAAVSSFGFSGTNAHAVIEQAPPREHPSVPPGNPQIFPLSARTPERLRQYAVDVARFVDEEEFEEDRLADLAHTFQSGRTAFQYRACWRVTDVADLKRQLEDFVAACTAGPVVQNAERLPVPARSWLHGDSVDWSGLHAGGVPHRMSGVPLYPFAQERHWVESANPNAGPAPKNEQVADASGIEIQLTGDEPELRDHVIGGRKVAPGVFLLSLMQGVLARHAGAPAERMTDVFWKRPVTVDGSFVLTARLQPRDGGLAFELSDGAQAEPNCTGMAFPGGAAKGGGETRRDGFDLTALQGRCGKELSVSVFYGSLEAAGLQYGPTYRRISDLRVGDGEALAVLQERVDTAPLAGTLDPGVLDAALHLAAAVAIDEAQSGRAIYAFSLRAARITPQLHEAAYAYTRRKQTSEANGNSLEFDSWVLDRAGQPVVAFEGVTLRATGGAGLGARGRDGVFGFVPAWEPGEDPKTQGQSASPGLVFLAGLPGSVVAPLQGALDCPCVSLSGPLHELPPGKSRAMVETALLRIQSHISADGLDGVPTIVLIEAERHGDFITAPIGALLKTLRREEPRIRIRHIRVAGDLAHDAVDLRKVIEREVGGPPESEIRYATPAQRERLRNRRLTLEGPRLTTFAPFASGTHWILGGAGQLGRVIAKSIAAEGAGTIVLSGRSEPSPSAVETLKALGGPRTDIHYIQANASDERSLAHTAENIREHFGRIDGVIHCAGIIRDALMRQKIPDEIREVFPVKASGAYFLDRVTCEDELRYFVLFSSIAAAWGNVGQADYAAANAFLGRFAEYRTHLVEAGRRHGKTVAIEWPEWRSGQMQLSGPGQRAAKDAGLRPLEDEEGWEILKAAVEGEHPRITVVAGDETKIAAAMMRMESGTVAVPSDTSAVHVPKVLPAATAVDGLAADPGEQRGTLVVLLKALLSEIAELPADAIRENEPFDAYGVDSLMSIAFTEKLRDRFEDLPKTLLFEQPTIAGVANYLCETHPEAVAALHLEQSVGRGVAAEASPTDPSNSGALRAPPVSKPPVRSDDAVAAPAAAVKDVAADGKPALTGRHDAVAILGMSGRFPKAATLDEFWENLRSARDCITEIPEERWDPRVLADSDGETAQKWGGFIEGADLFDPLFFNISPREAERMDPQERLFLECAWQACEDAGYARRTLDRDTVAGGLPHRTGVFAGAMFEEYPFYGIEETLRGNRLVLSGNPAGIANRLSYALGLTGPSMCIDTMCSSSLTAIHLAVQSLQSGDCDAAFAGAVNLNLHPNKYLFLSEAKFLSSNGRCMSFGAGGDGYVPSEGVGVVLLKPLAAALRDGDPVRGVILGSAVNHGGRSAGYTVPNIRAQSEVIRAALEKAGLEPGEIDYVEAHGTGTELGDPIEVSALAEAFGVNDPDCARQHVWPIGSVKANVGHCEGAAGMAALAKVLLQFHHRQLAPSIHTETLNPNIDFDSLPFRVQRDLTAWPARADREASPLKRIASISSFGAGGSNSHLVVADLERSTSFGTSRQSPVIVPLSAREEDRLVPYAERILEAVGKYVAAREAAGLLQAVAFTLEMGREPMTHRLAILAGGLSDLLEALESFVSGADDPRVFRGNARRPGPEIAGLIDSGRETAKCIDWAELGEWAEIARAWSQGLSFDWLSLWRRPLPMRISLPAYPFRRERYWPNLSAPPGMPAGGPKAHSSPSEPNSTQGIVHRFREIWTPRQQAGSRAELTDVFYFCETDEQVQRFRDALRRRRRSVSVIPVMIANEAARLSDGICGPWHHPDGAQEVLDLVVQEMGSPLNIVWRAPSNAGNETISALAALIKATRGSGKKLGYLALAAVGEDSRALSFAAALSGFEKSLGLAAPNVSVTAVSAESETLLDLRLADELGRPGTVRDIAGEAHVAALRKVDSAYPSGKALLEGGVYLITGGGGALGRLYADYLARNWRARLVLIGRRPGEAGLRRLCEELRSAGAHDAVYLSCDIVDGAAVRETVRDVVRRFGRLDGVLHIAGVPSYDSIYNLDADEIAAVIGAKVDGTVHLDEATAELPLGLFCVFSSAAAQLGDTGACVYSAANRFQSEYVRSRAEGRNGVRNGRSLVLNWPLWRIGMGEGLGRKASLYLSSSGQRAIEPEEALTVFETALGGEEPQELVLCGTAERIDRLVDRLNHPQVRTPEETNMPGGGRSRTVGPAEEVAARRASGRSAAERIREDLAHRVSRLLKLPEERIEDEATFEQFGFESVTLNELRDELARDYGIELTPVALFDHPTIAALSDHLAGIASPHSGAGDGGSTEDEQTGAAPPNTPVPDTTGQDADVSRAGTPYTVPLEQPAGRAKRAGSSDGAVAIVGMSGRFPNADDIDAFWTSLMLGKSGIGHLTDWRQEEWRRLGSEFGLSMQTIRGGFLDGIEYFDPLFFDLSPAECRLVDPRQRLLLEEAWRALENSGYGSRAAMGGSCSVFVGVEDGEYAYLTREHTSLTGVHSGVLAARLSHLLDLTGPNLAINTACSSGLVALHQAARSLAEGDSSFAIAAAVSLLLTPFGCAGLDRLGLLSPSGICRPFDARGDGLVPGEAVIALLLRPLTDAIKAGDTIYGVIEATHVNYDGRTNGIVSPSSVSQTRLMRALFDRSEIDPQEVDLVVAHSVGGRNVDPVEIEALKNVLGEGDAHRTALMSPKPMVGHTFAASGLVGVAAACCALRAGEIPPFGNLDRISDHVRFDGTGLYLPNAASELTGTAGARCALVTATGMSGTNASTLISRHPEDNKVSAGRNAVDGPVLVVLSARTEDALKDQAAALVGYLSENRPDIRDLAYTLQLGREAFDWRLAIVIEDIKQLVPALRAYLEGGRPAGLAAGRVVRRSKQRGFSREEAEAALRAFRERPFGLAQDWVAGLDADWALLYETGRSPRRIPLPTYRFRRRPLWPAASVGQAEAPPDTAAAGELGLSKGTQRICVIGAGPSGLVMAKSLLEEGHEPVVLERQKSLGGLWSRSKYNGAGGYKDLRFQTSKFTSTFSDFQAREEDPTFFDSQSMSDYLHAYADHFGVKKHIRFGCEVVSVRQEGERWLVAYEHSGGGATEEIFDGVAMCQGNFWKPKMPPIQGLADFGGEVVHAGAYWDRSNLEDKRVLVIGDGVSGMDIAAEAATVAQSVAWSVKRRRLILPRMTGFVPNDFISAADLLAMSGPSELMDRMSKSMPQHFEMCKIANLLPNPGEFEAFPVIHINDDIVKAVFEGRVTQMPQVERFTPDGCQFKDGSFGGFDVVLFCTGYEIGRIEFLEDIEVDRDFSMGLFFEKDPKLVNASSVFLVASSGSFYFYEMVARWYAQILSGKQKLSEADAAARIAEDARVMVGPVSAVLFGLKLGVIPSPEEDFQQFWRVFTSPPFPVAQRLCGPHSDPEAQAKFQNLRRRAFLRDDRSDGKLANLKLRILGGLQENQRRNMLARGQISEREFEDAANPPGAPLTLDWSLQFARIRLTADENMPVAAPARHPTRRVAASTRNGDGDDMYSTLFELVRDGTVDASLLETLLEAGS